MVRFALAATILAVLITCAFAQEAEPQPEFPKVQAFGGFVFFHADTPGMRGPQFSYAVGQPPNTFGIRKFFQGWDGQAQYNVSRWIGFAVDAGGRYGSPFTLINGIEGLPNGNTYSFLAGPVLSYRTKSIFTPFVHTLFGWDRTTLEGGTIDTPRFPVVVRATTYYDFVMALGGGVDARVSRHISVRPAQLDWYHSSLNQDNFYMQAFGLTQYLNVGTKEQNYRFATGIVVKF
jgi:opacity protein-like surface antigen